jgi:hypothetical protein
MLDSVPLNIFKDTLKCVFFTHASKSNWDTLTEMPQI